MPNLITRRSFFRLGTVSVLAAPLSGLLFGAGASADEVCNPGAPSTPAAALTALLQGNLRWASGNQQHPGEDETRRTCLANNKQTPFASILSCSDSRVAPELIFDQGLGELFVARVAGNTASGRLIDSLLYGTTVLPSQLLFVLGHSVCGAVDTAVRNYPRPHKLPFVNLIFPAVKKARAIVRDGGGDPKDPLQVIPVATQQNVILTVNRLRKQFRVNPGLLVAGGVYDLGTQLVTVVAQ
jgi:carbonic anhydrase